jgi:hypothetical protein
MTPAERKRYITGISAYTREDPNDPSQTLIDVEAMVIDLITVAKAFMHIDLEQFVAKIREAWPKVEADVIAGPQSKN